MGKKIQLLLASLILLANIFIPQASTEAAPALNSYTRVNLTPAWTTGIISDGALFRPILVSDFNQDHKTDILTCSYGHVYTISETLPDQYDTTWYSENIGCSNITTGDRDSNGVREFYISTFNGQILIFDGRTHKQIGRFALPAGTEVNDIDVADVDSDGKQELVLVNSYTTLVYDAATYKLEWQADGFGGNQAAIGNLDGDLAPEIIVNGNPSHVLNAGLKTQKWGYTGGFGVKMDVGDVDGDKRIEIAFFDAANNAYVLDGDTKKIKWQKDNLGSLSDVAVSDVDGDGISEVLYGKTESGGVTGYQGTDGTSLWNIPSTLAGVYGIGVGDANNDGVNEVLWDARLLEYDYGENRLSVGSWKSQTVQWTGDDLDGNLRVAIGDVDADGKEEIVMASATTASHYASGAVKVYDGITHRLKASTVLGTNSASVFEINHVAVGQLDSDPQLEIVLSGKKSIDPILQIYDVNEGKIEWTSSKLNDEVSVLQVRDLDGDGIGEIVMGFLYNSYETTRILVISAFSGVVKWDSGLLTGAYGDFTLGYLNNDAVLDLAIVTNKRVYVFRTDTWKQQLSREFSNGKKLAITSASDKNANELVIASYNENNQYTLQGLNGVTYNQTWMHTLDDNTITIIDLESADLDADGKQEIIVTGDYRDSVYNSHSLLWIGSNEFPSFWEYKLDHEYGMINESVVTDLNKDGKKELLISSEHSIQINNISSSSYERNFAYLPFLIKPQAGISGHVTVNGTPADYIYLHLRFYDGNTWSTVNTTTTNPDGTFLFPYVTSLKPGQYYYVLFLNDESGDSNRLWTWHTQSIGNFKDGDGFVIGDFDLANIALTSPSNGQKAYVPATFQWARRAASPSDSYEFNLFDPYTENPFFYTNPPLGYVGKYTLNPLPSGFNTDTLYGWNVWVYSPDGGFGVSYETRAVFFANTNRSSSLSKQMDAQSITPKDLEMMDIQARP